MQQAVVQKILIADDQQLIRELLSKIFTRSGYNVRTSEDGADALRQFNCEDPDLLITDLNMPEIDGYELCQRVRSVSDIPIMLITASSNRSVKRKALLAGANAFLTKPIDLEEIKLMVYALINRIQIPPIFLRKPARI